MTDKSKHTTLFYSKNALSFRSFHKEGFYREKSLFTRLFCSFCRQMKLKMPLGCLSNTSRMPPKCPLGEIYKQQNNLFTADEACHVAVNMWGFKVSKRSVFAILSPGNHQESARDPIEKLVKIAYK